MGRIRSVRPELWQDEDFAGLTLLARLTLLALLAVVDDDGRTQGRAVVLMRQCYPWGEVAESDLRGAIVELADADFVALYDHAGKPVIQVVGWDDSAHPMAQVVPKARKSRLADPPKSAYRKGTGTLPEEYRNATRPRTVPLPGDRTGGTDGRTGLDRTGRTDGTPESGGGLRSGSGSAGGLASAPPAGKWEPLDPEPLLEAIRAIKAQHPANSSIGSLLFEAFKAGTGSRKFWSLGNAALAAHHGTVWLDPDLVPSGERPERVPAPEPDVKAAEKEWKRFEKHPEITPRVDVVADLRSRAASLREAGKAEDAALLDEQARRAAALNGRPKEDS